MNIVTGKLFHPPNVNSCWLWWWDFHNNIESLFSCSRCNHIYKVIVNWIYSFLLLSCCQQAFVHHRMYLQAVYLSFHLNIHRKIMKWLSIFHYIVISPIYCLWLSLKIKATHFEIIFVNYKIKWENFPRFSCFLLNKVFNNFTSILSFIQTNLTNLTK